MKIYIASAHTFPAQTDVESLPFLKCHKKQMVLMRPAVQVSRSNLPKKDGSVYRLSSFQTGTYCWIEIWASISKPSLRSFPAQNGVLMEYLPPLLFST